MEYTKRAEKTFPFSGARCDALILVCLVHRLLDTLSLRDQSVSSTAWITNPNKVRRKQTAGY